MPRIVNPDSAGKQRLQLTKAIALAVRELARQTAITDETRDLAAFIAVALRSIAEGIDLSVAAWEKRGYWVKADKFRMEWAWAGPTAHKMQSALVANDWATVATLSAQIGEKFGTIKISAHHRIGKPWVGAFKKLTASRDFEHRSARESAGNPTSPKEQA